MKIFKLISVLLITLIMLFLVAGCNNKEDNKDYPQQTTASDVETGSTVSTTEVTEATQQDTEVTQSETIKPSYVPESDELEILTPNISDNSGNNTPDPVVTVPDAQQNTTPQATETFPELDDIIDEPIELPFVPID